MKNIFSTLLTLVHVTFGLDFSAEECRNLGFNKAQVLCSSCDDLSRFSVSTDIISNCRNCCNDEGRQLDSRDSKYPKAILEVCGWRLGAYPQVAAFIKSDRPKRYSGLSIKYVRGADPVIKLLDDANEIIETLAIDKWNTDSVEEFLDIYLIKDGGEEEEIQAPWRR